MNELVGTLNYLGRNRGVEDEIRIHYDGNVYSVTHKQYPELNQSGKSKKEAFSILLSFASMSMKDWGFSDFTWEGREYYEWDLEKLNEESHYDRNKGI